MPTATKMTFDRLDASRSLLTRARSQRDQVVADLTARLTPLLEQNEELPDVAHLLRLLERLLQSRREHLAEANATSSHDADALTVLLHRRDAAARRLYTSWSTFAGRSSAASVAHPAPGRPADAAGATCDRPPQRPTTPAPSRGDPGRPTPTRAVGAAATAVPGRAARDPEQIDAARGKTVGSVTSKRDALADFDATYGRVARFLETLWDLADGRYKPQKLRPTANPARAAGKVVAAPQAASRACLKGKTRKTSFQQPTEPSSRAKPSSRAVRNEFRALKSSQHRRPTPLRRLESNKPQRLAAWRWPGACGQATDRHSCGHRPATPR